MSVTRPGGPRIEDDGTDSEEVALMSEAGVVVHDEGEQEAYAFASARDEIEWSDTSGGDGHRDGIRADTAERGDSFRFSLTDIDTSIE